MFWLLEDASVLLVVCLAEVMMLISWAVDVCEVL